MTTSIIQKSELEGALRIDAEYYQPNYLQIKKKLSSSTALKEVSKKITDFGAYSQMNFVEYVESGVRFLRNQDVSDFFMNDSDPVYVTDKIYQRLSLKLEELDIIIPRVGTLGNSIVIFEQNLPATANQNLAQIKVNKSKVDPIYLGIFLCSKYGKQQFERAATGNVQPWLNLQQIQNLKVFLPENKIQQTVRYLALDALGKYKSSFELYAEGEELLLSALGLKKSDFDDELSYTVNLSEAAERVDAEYFQPKYQKLLDHLGKNYKKLVDLAPRQLEKIAMKKDKTYKYTEISDINAGNGEAGYHEVEAPELPANATMKLNGGELIISKVRPTRSAISIIPDNWSNDFVASGAFSIFKLPSPLREYVQIVLRSFIGKLQMERPTTGTSYPTITDKDIENLVIPILPNELQQKIGDLIHQSYAARQKSKELLDQAKRQVEELIEGKAT